MVALNRETYGTIVTSDNSKRYQLKREDLLWLGRSFQGEAGRLGRLEYSALAWCYAQRIILWDRFRGEGRPPPSFGTTYPTYFSKMVRLHSQPINPRWMEGGEFCIPGGKGFGQDRCSEPVLARRAIHVARAWEDINEDIRRAIVDWAEGRVDNPIPKYTDFAGRNTQERGRFIERLQVTPRGNAFYKERGRASINWPDDYVKIEFDGNSTTDDPVDPAAESDPPADQESSGETQSEASPNVVREESITSNRTAPPSRTYQYWTLENSESEDPATSLRLSEERASRVIQTRYDRFYNQLTSLRSATNLEMAQAVPVLSIKTEDENGNIQDLNGLIFSSSPLEDFQQNQGENLPFRPIASIELMTLKIEQPSVGGVTGVTTANLTIKVHNPELISSAHPRGKYIAWMMRQGFSMRIRYGTNGPDVSPTNNSVVLRNSFQTKEEDFYVAQHDINISDDKSYQLKLTLMPAVQKLMNQMQIGESIPFSDLGSGLTESDIDVILDNINAGGLEQNEAVEIKRRLRLFRGVFNSGVPSPGYRLSQRSGENVTFGSVLHGAISQTDILSNSDGVAPVPIDNMVDALKSVQSIILTRRIESLLEEDAYQYNFAGVAKTVVTNVGPIMYKLVLPEVQQIILYANQNNLRAGEVYSSDQVSENPDNESETRRTNVVMAFGNFNERAGQWAGDPISSIPVNVNSLFTLLRRNRDVGKFSSTINEFMQRINSLVNEATNYRVERQSGDDDSGRPEHPLERPQIKYAIYPSPENDSDWIMYIYDQKEELVRFRNLVGELSTGGSVANAPRDEIIDRLDELQIPWIEMGDAGTIIKQMSARTQADDLILAHNMIQSNTHAITPRDVDGNYDAPNGIYREFLHGAQRDLNTIINSTTVVLPIETSLVTYILVTGFIFAPVYVFFPTKMFEGLYLVHILEHEVKNGSVQSRMTLQINMTTRNRLSE